MMRLILLGAFALLMGCGADGPPEPPGVSVTGEARIGVTTKL